MSRIFLLVLILISTKNIFACNWVKPNKITLDSLFSEGVVLQRDKTIAIWGTATENNLPVEVSLQDQNVKTTTENKKWKVEFKPLDAGGPYTLKVSSNTSTLQIPSVYVGDVWLAGGQSNMLWQLKNTVEGKAYIASQSKDDYIRLYKAKLGYNREPNIADCNGISLGTWKAANKDTVPTFSAVAYHFARNLREKLNVPIGIISTPVGGSPIESWISHDYYLKHDNVAYILDRQKKAEERFELHGGSLNPKTDPYKPSALHSYMVAPLKGYAIKGIIWYQGEHNATRAHEYGNLFSALIQGWREDFSLDQNPNDLPFLFVQLSSLGKIVSHPQESNWAKMREVQRLISLTEPNVAMVVSSDVGDEKDIHPRRKKPVGDRLALAALNIAYNNPYVVFNGPVLNRVKLKKNKIVLNFTNVEKGLKSCDGKPLREFEVSFNNGPYEMVDAVIVNNSQVEITPNQNPKISQPIHIRMGWRDYVQTNLCNSANFLGSSWFSTSKRVTRQIQTNLLS